MRRNICNGRFELWRLFLTDADSLPVKKMSFDTTFRELRSSHRRSPFNQPRFEPRQLIAVKIIARILWGHGSLYIE